MSLEIQFDEYAKPGLRIRMLETMDDINPIVKGEEGTIYKIDDIGNIIVNWDNGRMLSVIPNVDKYEILPSLEDQVGLDSFNESGPITKKYNTSLKQVLNKEKVKLKERKNKSFKKKKEEDLDETMTAGGGGGLAGSAGYSYVAPLGTTKKQQKESKSIKVKDFISEITDTKNTDFTTGTDGKIWADKNKDGWRWNDKPAFHPEGEVIDPLANIESVWDDNSLDISNEWDKYQNKKKKEDLSEGKKKTDKIHTKKWDRCVDAVKAKNKENKTDYNPYAVCQSSIGYEGSIKKSHRREEIEEEEEVNETTTFASVWGVNGPPSTPMFAAKKGQHIPSKKPLWKGGQIIQKVDSHGIFNESEKKNSLLDEINKVKWTRGSKYVKIKDKCAKYNNQPWCSQGAIDNPLELSDNTFESVSNLAKKLGLSEEYILDKINEVLNKK